MVIESDFMVTTSDSVEAGEVVSPDKSNEPRCHAVASSNDRKHSEYVILAKSSPSAGTNNFAGGGNEEGALKGEGGECLIVSWTGYKPRTNKTVAS